MDFFNFNLFKATDIIWVPLSFLVVMIVAYLRRKKYDGLSYRKYYFPSLLLRLVFVIIYALVIQLYYGYGDTVMYYRAVLDMHHALSDNTASIQDVFFVDKITENNPAYIYFVYDGWGVTHYYMANLSNFNVSRFALPFSIAFGGSYLAISFWLSLFSFAGCWRIFKMFREMYPGLERHFAFGILYLPSILFWGGSLLKDSICLGAMGFTLYAVYQIFVMKRKIPSSLLLLLLNSILLLYIKPYILFCLAPGLLIWMYLELKSRILSRSVRQFTGVVLLIVMVVGGGFLFQSLTATEIASQYSSDRIVSTAQSVQSTFGNENESGGGSNFNSLITDQSLFSQLLSLPIGFITTFFRPFIFEVRNPLMLISAMEALIFLYITVVVLRRVGFKQFFLIAMSERVVIFCLIFSVSFGAIIGSTTTNFGALARYKIPCLSFYLFAFFIVMLKSGKFTGKPLLHRKIF